MPCRFVKIVALGAVLLVLHLLGSGAEGAAVALSTGADAGRANWRPQVSDDPIGVGIVGGDGRYWWTPAGESWHLGVSGEWSRITGLDLPVPVDEVRFITEAVLFTITGEVYHTIDESWVRAQPFPG
ncbi:MAG: hypothetical protein ABIK65_07240 [Candidatus Eisenbacteria bacterium]